MGEEGTRFGNFQNVGVHSSLSKTHTSTVITIIWDSRGTESTGGGSPAMVGTKFQFRGRSYYSILHCSGEGGVGPHSRAITSASLLHLLLSLWLSSTAPRNIIIVITRNASFHLNYTLTTSTGLTLGSAGCSKSPWPSPFTEMHTNQANFDRLRKSDTNTKLAQLSRLIRLARTALHCCVTLNLQRPYHRMHTSHLN